MEEKKSKPQESDVHDLQPEKDAKGGGHGHHKQQGGGGHPRPDLGDLDRPGHPIP